MPNRFDRRLKGSGLIPGSSSCKTNTVNVPMNNNITNTKKTNNTSVTNSRQINLKTNVNTMVILENHKTSINKLNDMIKKVVEEFKETEKKNESNYNFTYNKINDIETFLENITFDNSLNIKDEEVDASNNITLSINEVNKSEIDISNKKNIFDYNIINNKINELMSRIDILSKQNEDKVSMNELTKQTRLNTLFIKKLFEDKIDNDMYKKMKVLNKTMNDIKFKLKKITETQEMLKKMCIDNDNYIKKYKLRKEKTISEQKQKMKSIIPEIPEYDKKYDLRGVPDRLIGGLNIVKPMRDIIPDYTTQKKKKTKQKNTNKSMEMDEQMIKELEMEIKMENNVKNKSMVENA